MFHAQINFAELAVAGGSSPAEWSNAAPSLESTLKISTLK